MHFLHAGDEIVPLRGGAPQQSGAVARVAEATGAKLVYLYPGADGRLTTGELDAKITDQTRLVAVAEVSNGWGCAPPWRRS